MRHSPLSPYGRALARRDTRGGRSSARTTAAAIAALVIGALVAASCGGDDETGANAVPSATVDVTFATQPPIAGAADTTAPGSSVSSAPASSDPSSGGSGTTAADTTGTTAAPGAGGSAAPPAADLGDPVVAFEQIGGVSNPVDIAWRAGDPTMFMVSKPGKIIPLRNGEEGDSVLDVIDITSDQGEQGLLGLTFSADGTRAYINHTDNDGHTVIAEYAVGADGVFDATSRRELITIEQPYPNHNGGNVAIGPDGMLYIGMGDGGSGGDPERYSLNVTSLLGKMLRIDPTPSADLPYTVPADNPFVGVAGARPEIWSVGLRNPWRFSFDSLTGDLWIGDVGQGEIEEISVGWAADGGGRGINFGWSAFEGTNRFNDDQPADGATPPVHEYDRSTGGCSVTGGAVYRGDAIPALAGWYVFGDYCNRQITAIRVQDRVVTDITPLGEWGQVTAIRESPGGDLYLIAIEGTIDRLVPG